MKKIKVTIKANSAVAVAFKKHMAEKDAFRSAVKSGKIAEFISATNTKFDSPVSLNC